MKEIFEFIKKKNQLQELLERSGASRNTVITTFKKESFEELKGKQIDVYREAVKLIEEINLLPKRAEEALGK